jgi:DMSO/TMAO reductase YedYZ molybdopterin-dependent catalytic subunit
MRLGLRSKSSLRQAARGEYATGSSDCIGRCIYLTMPWEGVAVAAILARAGVEPTARFLKVYAGNFTVLLPLEEALRGGALLARRLNGKPLTREHGAPLRLVAPGRACFYSVKWVDRLEVLAEEAPTTGASIARNRLPR